MTKKYFKSDERNAQINAAARAVARASKAFLSATEEQKGEAKARYEQEEANFNTLFARFLDEESNAN